MYWAIASGIEGNLPAYEALLKDLRQSQVDVDELFLIGDVIGPHRDSAKLIDRIQSPKPGEPQPAVCQGWWEEQLLILHGLGRLGEPTELIDRYGKPMTKTLWDAVPRAYVDWIRSLEFGFSELDCLMIHGTSLGVDDELTPETPVITMLDRLQRMGVNQLFCGRSGQAFDYEIQQGALATTVLTLTSATQPQQTNLIPKRVVGVGNVGRRSGEATYVLYHPGSNEVTFKTIKYSTARGFGAAQSV
jgi:hypothetical protein